MFSAKRRKSQQSRVAAAVARGTERTQTTHRDPDLDPNFTESLPKLSRARGISQLESCDSLGDEWSDPAENDSEFLTAAQLPTKGATQAQVHQNPQPGVQIPALLSDFFGIDFLPISDHISVSNGYDGQPLSHFLLGQSEPSKLRLEVEQLGSTGHSTESTTENSDREVPNVNEDETATDERDKNRSAKRKPKGRRLKKAYGALKNAATRRRHDVSDQSSLERQSQLRSASNDVHGSQVGSQLKTLEHHKSELARVQLEALSLQLRVETVVRRVQTSQEQIRELEKALALSVNKLQKDDAELKELKRELYSVEQRRIATTTQVDAAKESLVDAINPLVASSGHSPDRRSVSNQAVPLTPKARNDDDHVRPQSEPLANHSKGSIEGRPRGFTVDELTRLKKAHRFDTDSSASLPLRTRSSSCLDLKKQLRRVNSSFIRIHDLDIIASGIRDSSSESSSSLSQGGALCPPDDAKGTSRETIIGIDQDVGAVLDALIRYGYGIIVDEGDRFRPVQNTERLIAKTAGKSPPACWPIHPWHIASGSDILVWQGTTNIDGPGKNLPVIKARGIVETSPELVLGLLMDSSRVGEYNKMSQGRSDLLYLQQGVHKTAQESKYNIAGEAKIIRALNRPPVIRRNIEMLTLIYARPLEEHTSSSKGFISVSRSVWEDEKGVVSSSDDTIRSEMLLGVSLLREVLAADGQCHCELTTITHVHTTAVPEMLAKRMAPSHAVGYIKEIQSVFSK